MNCLVQWIWWPSAESCTSLAVKGKAWSVGFHVCVCVLSCFHHVWLFATLWTIAHQVSLSVDSPGKNTGVGYYVLLREIFPTQGSNLHLLCLLHWQVGSLPAPPGKSSGNPWQWLNYTDNLWIVGLAKALTTWKANLCGEWMPSHMMTNHRSFQDAGKTTMSTCH